MKLWSVLSLPVLLMFFSLSAFAQVPDPVVAAQSVNHSSGHQYIGMGGETVNPADGSVSFNLPLDPAPGRQLSMPFAIRYASPESFYIENEWTSKYLYWTLPHRGTPFQLNGWGYQIPSLSGQAAIMSQHPQNCLHHETVQVNADGNYVFRGFDGVQRSLDIGTEYEDTNFQTCTGDDFPPPHVPKVYTYSNAHGVIATLRWPENWPTAGPTQPAITVSDQSGTVYKFASNGRENLESGVPQFPSGVLAQTITDRNGNQISLNPDTQRYNDTLGRPVVNHSYNDTLGRTVVAWDELGTEGGNITVAGMQQPVVVHWTTTDVTLPLTGEFINNTHGCWAGSASFTLKGISEIDLPNGQKYQFVYGPNSYGRISKIIFPGGGYVRYEWGLSLHSAMATLSYSEPNPSGGYWSNRCQLRYDIPAVRDRYVSYDGQTEVLHQHFEYDTHWDEDVEDRWSSKTTTITSTSKHKTATSSGLASSEQTTITTYTFDSVRSDPGGPTSSSWMQDQVPVETSIVYADGNGHPLKTVRKTWKNYAALVSEQTVLHSGQSTKTTTTFRCYDSNEQVTKIYELDEGTNYTLGQDPQHMPACDSPSGGVAIVGSVTAGPILRQASTTFYPFFQGPPSNYNKEGYEGNIVGTHIVNAPDRIKVLDASGTKVQETTFSYTNDTTSSGAQTGLVAPAGDRGNVLAVARWRNSDGAWPTTSYTWFDTGQVKRKTDACGNGTCAGMVPPGHATDYTYGGSTHAYLTEVKYGDDLHKEQFTWDYSSGQVTSHTDANGRITNYTYGTPPRGCSSSQDQLNRLTEIKFPSPDGGTTSYCYDDNARRVTTTKSINSQNLVTTAVMDGMGHTVRTSTDSYPGGPVNIDTSYNGFGNVDAVSNPYRSGSSPNEWTTYDYDPLGRQKVLTHPDGTSVQTQYDLYTTTVTDETLRQRQATVDALGRLVTVVEPDPSTSTGSLSSGTLTTSYTYDALNNLTKVVQNGSRQRSFTYDSLSQLLCAANPETAVPGQGVATCPASATSLSGYIPGTIAYKYDLNGNLIQKTAPSPNDGSSGSVSTNYFYDGLNRLTSKSYSDPATASACYQYDESAQNNGVGRLKVEWTGNCSDPASAITRRSIQSYDTMGRIRQETQCTPFNCNVSGRPQYSITHGYDFLGNETLLTNGIGSISFTAEYNGANLLKTFASSWDDTTHPGTLFSAPDSAYSPVGLTDATLGTNLKLHRAYDSRLRPISETDTGFILQTPAAAASAQVTITGQEKSKPVPTVSTGTIRIDPASGVQAVPGSASVTISGSLKTNTVPATPGTGTVSISGSEQQIAAATQASGSVTISGSLQSKQVQSAAATSGSATITVYLRTSDYVTIDPCQPYSCPQQVYNQGPIFVTLNGTRYSGLYDSNSTAAAAASSLASSLNTSSLVTAVASGNTVTVTARATGAGSNYSLSYSCDYLTQFFSSCAGTASGPSALSGGKDTTYTTVYDSGTALITVNGERYPAPWSGSGTTATSIASSLASSMAGSPSVDVRLSGTTITLTSKQTGTAANYSLSASSTFDSGNFGSGTFSASASGSTLAGGKDATYDSGTTTVTVNGHPTPYPWSGASTTQSSIAQGLAGAINGDGGAAVTATYSGNTVTLTAKSTGLGTTYSLSSSTSSQKGSFSSTAGSGSLRDGKDIAYISDSGSAEITINRQTISTPWSGSATTYSSIATALRDRINSSSSYASATASGGTIYLTAKRTDGGTGGVSTNYPFSVRILNNSSDFPTSSFKAEPPEGAFSGGKDDASTQSGTAVLNVGPSSVSVAYAPGDSASAIASRLASALGPCGGSALVSATPLGSTLSLTSCSKGSSVNYPVTFTTAYDTATYSAPAFSNSSGSMEHGTDSGGTIYDHGTVTLTVNGITRSTTYGQNSNAASVAAGLAAAFSGNSQVKVEPIQSGSDTLQITARSLGEGGNSYSYRVDATTSDTANFGSASFSGPLTGSLNGGQNEVRPAGTVYSYTVDYHGNGNVKSVNDSVMGTWSYPATGGYDALNRLKTAVSSAGPYNGVTINWSYDAWGNRLEQTPSGANPGGVPSYWARYDNVPDNRNNATNRVVSASDVPAGYEYSSSGNVLKDANYQYTYDAENRVIAVQPLMLNRQPDAVSTRYVYDAEGRRVAKQNGAYAVTASYVLGLGGEQMTEMDGNGDWVHTNAFAGGKLLATYDKEGSIQPLHFHLSDWLGTRRVQTGFDGTLELAFRSLPFGDGLTTVGPNGSSNYGNACSDNQGHSIPCFDSTEHHFTAKERDSETGNDYFLARYYASNMGRFLTPDWAAKAEPVPYAKLDDPQSLNLYSYVRNNPLSRADSDGHSDYLWQRTKNWFSGNGWKTDAQVKGLSVAQTAQSHLGSKDWAINGTNTSGKDVGHPQVFKPGSNKCNQFVGDTLAEAGKTRPEVTDKNGNTRMPSAHEMADPNVHIPGLSGPKPLSEARPGDVIAQEHGDVYGHTGIVVMGADGKLGTVSANASGNYGGQITQNDWGFRPAGQNGESMTDPAPVIRRPE